MSGAGNDAPPITSTSSSQEPALSDRSKSSTPQYHGSSGIHTDVAVQEIHESTRQDPQRNMAGEEGAIVSSTQVQPPKIRVYFDEFAAQIRLHRQQYRHARVLRLRQESLQKSIALTERLRRVGRVVQDGLLDLSSHNDKAGFARVYHCINELSTTCHARWRSEFQAHDIPVDRGAENASMRDDRKSFTTKLSQDSQKDLSRLLNSIRCEPGFLVDRIKALSQVQLEGICLQPGEEPQSSVLPQFSQNRNSRSQGRRNVAFANSLEDFAISLERKEPLKFMLCNVFGIDQDLESPEHWLRLDTWSTVCAELYLLDCEKYQKLISRILYIFASFRPWRAAERLSRYFMDVLQRGAVLLETVDKTPVSSFRALSSEPLDTAEAETFFENAIQELIGILCQHDGGLPQAALQFASAVVGKLPSVESQSNFRGHVLFQWFFGEFLASAISCPENENMLLTCHVSKHARSTILHSLSRRFNNRVRDVYSEQPLREVPISMRDDVDAMVYWLKPLKIDQALIRPSLDSQNVSSESSKPQDSMSFIVVCSTEIISLLDTLCPLPGLPSTGGWDPFLMSTASAFQSQYARTNTTSRTNFDQLRRELSLFSEQSFSARLLHPGLEHWVVLPVRTSRKFEVQDWTANSTHTLGPDVAQCFADQDPTRQAAIRLASDYRKSYRHSSRQTISDSATSVNARDYLLDLFDDEYRHAEDRGDIVDARYWHAALEHLQDNYSLSRWTYDDTPVLKIPLQTSQEGQRLLELDIVAHENELLHLKDMYTAQIRMTSDILARLDKLRNKLWYMVDVVNSSIYEDAKNIAAALNSIAGSLLSPSDNSSEHSDTISLAGSILSQSSRETVGMLKAPSDHGGPKKLSDMQVDMIRKWLKRSNIENFCKGEERIHRFCMEIKLLAKRLAGENVNENSVLWLSELFAKEKALCFDSGNVLLGGFGGTSTPSVRSETLSSVYHSSRGASHALDMGFRLPSHDIQSSPARKSSFHSLGSSRIRTDVHPPDGSPSNGSPDRAYSSAASDTVSSLTSLWSPAAAQSQSATSVSTRSRPPSTYNEMESAKIADQTVKEKTKFLEELQQDLVCLLLSDLGCPVWSYGSETDAWLASAGNDTRVLRQLRQRHTSVQLLSVRERLVKSKRKPGRSRSVAHSVQKEDHGAPNETSAPPSSVGLFPYMEACQTLLERCSQHIDPSEKLQAIYDMKVLITTEMEDTSSGKTLISSSTPQHTSQISRSEPSSRRNSFNPVKVTTAQNRSGSTGPGSIEGRRPTSFVAAMQPILEKLKPKTLFRDLQYISVFVPQETLNKTERGKALTDFGLAALAYKADIAQAMVDIATRAYAEGSSSGLASSKGKRSLLEQKYADASTFLLIAAREGNATAQREVAGLYLWHPEMKQLISSPLSFTTNTFKKENEWQKQGDDGHVSSQAMCLALHWMQQAAMNGDKIAKEKLKKREESISL